MTKGDQEVSDKAIEAAENAWINTPKRPGDIRDALRAAIAAYLSSPWQPIESAPKDGKAVQVWDPTTGWVPYASYDDDDDVWIGGLINISPTHWQPLPDPPKPKETK
jgi:hypothetical protein